MQPGDLTTVQVAARLNISTRTLDRIRQKGQIGWVRAGGERGPVYFTEQDVQEYLQRNRRPAADWPASSVPWHRPQDRGTCPVCHHCVAVTRRGALNAHGWMMIDGAKTGECRGSGATVWLACQHPTS